MFGSGMEMDGFEFSIPLPIIPLPYRPENFVYDTPGLMRFYEGRFIQLFLLPNQAGTQALGNEDRRHLLAG